MTQLHLGWHFCPMRDGRPVLRDGTALVIGREYEHAGALAMCESGYHDSERVIDALKYAPGAYLCRTLSSADVTDGDKRVSRYRRAIAGFDATRTLHEFSVRIAYCALLRERERGREPDPRSWEALRVKQRWLIEDASDDELSAAEAAAEAAAWAAVSRAAAGTAAWSAAEAAAEAAAWARARAATWSAADQMLLAMLPPKLVNP